MALRFNIPFLKMQGPMNIRAYRLSATTQNTNTPLHLHRLSDLPISGVGALHIAPPIYHLTQSCHNQLTTMKHRVQKRSPYTVSGYRHLKKRLLTTHNKQHTAHNNRLQLLRTCPDLQEKIQRSFSDSTLNQRS